MSPTPSPEQRLEDLIQAEVTGTVGALLPFWGHRGTGVGPWVLSQWWPVSFTMGRYTLANAEMGMMAFKAGGAKDHETLEMILAESDPKKCKALGRRVRNYDDEAWSARRYSAVVEVNLAKFDQNPDLKEYLLSTAPAVLIEASPYDRIWGIGMGPADERVQKPSQWNGQNLLGFALTEVRERLEG